MLITILMIALAVNGGMYLGTLVYSAYKLANIDNKLSFTPDLGSSLF